MSPWFSEKKDTELEIERLKKELDDACTRIVYLEEKLRKIHEVFNDEHDIDCRNCKGET